MNIDLTILNEVIDEMLNDVRKKVNGELSPSLSKFEALRELGVILEMVYILHERIDEKRLRSEIWVLKNRIVKTTLEITGL